MTDFLDERRRTSDVRHRFAVVALAIGLTSGVVGMALLDGQRRGINVPLWLLGTTAASAWAVRRWRPIADPSRAWLLAPFALFALLLAVRASSLVALVLVAVMGLLAALMVLPLPPGRLARGSLGGYISALAAGLGALAIAPLLMVVEDVRWGELARASRDRRSAAWVRGVLISLPVLAVFFLLFAAADTAFREIAGDLVDVEGWEVARRAMLVIILAWLVVAAMRSALFRGLAYQSSDDDQRRSDKQRGASTGEEPAKEPADETATQEAADETASEEAADETATDEADVFALEPRGGLRHSIGDVEVAVLLGLVNLLFLAFVAVQVRYLFGGHDLVQARTGLSYAEYARQGFAELVIVAAITLALIAVVDHARRPAGRLGEVVFRGMSTLLTLLLGVVMVSAMLRLAAYGEAYGLTELRLLAAVILVWLFASTVWLVAVLLSDLRHRFAFGSFAAGVVLVALWALSNPAGIIARANLDKHQQRSRSSLSYDSQYAVSLGADAVPTLVDGLDDMPARKRKRVAKQLLQQWGSTPADHDWRELNLARLRAWHAVDEHRDELERSTRIDVGIDDA